VPAADVGHELIVDAHPHVVVADEPEDLPGSGLVREARVPLEGEVRVAVPAAGVVGPAAPLRCDVTGAAYRPPP
jgi:hypothetical protein